MASRGVVSVVPPPELLGDVISGRFLRGGASGWVSGGERGLTHPLDPGGGREGPGDGRRVEAGETSGPLGRTAGKQTALLRRGGQTGSGKVPSRPEDAAAELRTRSRTRAAPQ